VVKRPRRGRPPTIPGGVGGQFAFRLDPPIMREITAHMKWLQAQAPFATVSRSDAVRDLLRRGLESVKGQR
jgi:hypothetical protein